jgi:hypothetical protein
MESAGDQDYMGVNSNFLLMDDSKNQSGPTVKTVYRYGEKKHIVEVLDETTSQSRQSRQSQPSRKWYLIRLSKNKIEGLETESEKFYEEGILKSVKFSNGKTLKLPCPDPDYGKAPEVPKYGKKPLGIEFAFGVRGQIEQLLSMQRI